MNKLPYCEAICRETYRGITTETNCKNYARHTWLGKHVCKVHFNFYKRSAEKRLHDLTLSDLLQRAHGIGGEE